MAILSTDVKLMQSAVMLDTDGGGGAMSGTEIIDGLSNNLFPDISELDYTYGRVNLRKLFLSVRNAGVDSYYGSHMIIDTPPADPLVSVLLFTRGDWFDLRSDARNNIESYVVKAAPYSGYLMGDQLQGARAIVVLQREELALPKIGDVLYLSQANVGDQYVRITDITDEVRTYTVVYGSSTVDIKRRWVRISIASALLYTFNGNLPNLTDAPGSALLYTSQVADSAHYYGVKKIAQAVSTGALTLQVQDIFSPLVPSAQVETPFVDVQAGNGVAPVIASGMPGTAVTKNVTATVSADLHLYLGMGAVRKSVSVAGAGYIWQDDGAGNMVRGGLVEGSVNYATGEIIFTAPAVSPSSLILSFQPAAAPSAIAWSAAQDVTLSTRGYNWVATLAPIPAPGSAFVDYMAQGNWYRLTDDGKGNLTGDGSGTIDYATGSVIATTAALPDVDSQVIFSWGQKLEFVALPDINTLTTIKMPQITATLSAPVLPGSLTITWPSATIVKTATDDGHGNLTGDATGTVIYSTGEIALTPNNIHDPGAVYHAAWTQDTQYSMGVTSGSFTLANTPVRPYSVALKALYGQWSVTLYDNGAGSLVAAPFHNQAHYPDTSDYA